MKLTISVVSADSAITQLKAGAIDLYADGLASADLPSIKDAAMNYWRLQWFVLRHHVQPGGSERREHAQPVLRSEDPRGHELVV